VYGFCDGNAHAVVKEYKRHLPYQRIPSTTYFHTLNRQCMKPILFLVYLVISARAIYLTHTYERKFPRLLGEGHNCPCKELSCP